MPSNWEKAKLSDKAYEVRDLYEPNPNDNISYIGLEHIEQQSLRITGIGQSSVTISSKKSFKRNDILFGSLRPYFRKVVRPKFDGVCSTDITVIRAKPKTNQTFLHYFVAAQAFIDYATNISNGTRMPRANWNVLSKSEWLFPPLPIQHKIAATLSAYDDLIENNLRRIKIMEEMAQNLYTEWFVKFRFPGHEKVEMVDSPLGRIPEGWEIKRVKDIVIRLKAKKVYEQHDVMETGNIMVIDQSSNEFLGFHDDDADLIASSTFPIIIFGDHTCKMQLLIKPFSIGPNVVPFSAKDGQSTYYLFSLIHNLVETKEYKRHWTELTNNDVVCSHSIIVKQFDDYVEPLFRQVDVLRSQLFNLRSTRDLLLPRLISGELDVSDLDVKTGDDE